MSEKPVEEDQRLRGEGELTAELISAAQAAQGQLSLQEIDQILGVARPRGPHERRLDRLDSGGVGRVS